MTCSSFFLVWGHTFPVFPFHAVHIPSVKSMLSLFEVSHSSMSRFDFMCKHLTPIVVLLFFDAYNCACKSLKCVFYTPKSVCLFVCFFGKFQLDLFSIQDLSLLFGLEVNCERSISATLSRNYSFKHFQNFKREKFKCSDQNNNLTWIKL